MVIYVKTRLVFEAEYPLDMEFFEKDTPEDMMESERNAFIESPDLFVTLFKNIGTATITIEEVKESAAEIETDKNNPSPHGHP